MGGCNSRRFHPRTPQLMPHDSAADTPLATVTRHRDARRLSCRMSAEGHRWYTLSEPWQVSDGPTLCVCLHCTDVVSLQVAYPSYPNPNRKPRSVS